MEGGSVEWRKGCAKVVCQFLEEVEESRHGFVICRVDSILPTPHDVSPVMKEHGHGCRERLYFVGKLDEHRGQIELSPLLKGVIKVGIVVGYVMVEFASGIECRGQMDLFK